MKICTRCLVQKPPSAFSKHKQASDGLNPSCKECRNKQQRELYRSRNEEWIKERGEKNRRRSRFYSYGISWEEYEKMYAVQNGCCEICKEHQDVLAIDHCHTTLRNRGLLCKKCNSGLGFFRDNTEYLQSAIQYLNSVDKYTNNKI